MHASDCALVIYASVDPATLKQPLQCDCDESGEPEDAGGEPQDDQPLNVRPMRFANDVVLTGDVARAYRLLQGAETALRAAQKRKDEALRAFLEAATR